MRSTRDTIAMLRDQADHPNADGWAEIDPAVIGMIVADLEEAIASSPQVADGCPRLGSAVRWTSQSGGGSHLTKTGKVIRVVPAGERPSHPGLNNPGHARNHESYIVSAHNGRVYWPRVSGLEVIS
jgi:hypothetical protein